MLDLGSKRRMDNDIGVLLHTLGLRYKNALTVFFAPPEWFIISSVRFWLVPCGCEFQTMSFGWKN